MDRAEIGNSDVAAVFGSYEPAVAAELLRLRTLILETADEIDGVGPIEETLKWGQPSYLTTVTGSGSTIRLAPAGERSGHDYAMYFICSTNLVSTFEQMFGDVLSYDGNRALLFKLGDPFPENEIRECIRIAQTYHRTKIS